METIGAGGGPWTEEGTGCRAGTQGRCVWWRNGWEVTSEWGSEHGRCASDTAGGRTRLLTGRAGAAQLSVNGNGGLYAPGESYSYVTRQRVLWEIDRRLAVPTPPPITTIYQEAAAAEKVSLSTARRWHRLRDYVDGSEDAEADFASNAGKLAAIRGAEMDWLEILVQHVDDLVHTTKSAATRDLLRGENAAVKKCCCL